MASLWDRQLSDSQNALDVGDYNFAIQHSTRALENLFLQATSMVKLRERAWERKGDLTKQIEDATLILNWSPRDPQGYLHCGKLYAAQGKQYKAKEMFEKGIFRVKQKDAEVYDNLKAELYQAQARLSSHVDFIIKGPYDVFNTIVPYLSINDLNECVLVSHGWRSKIINCPPAWSKFHFDDDEGNDDISKEQESLAAILPKVTEHVKDITLRSNTAFVAKITRLMREKKFSSLEALHIWGLVYERNDPPDNFTFDQIAYVLPNIAKTLNALSLMLWRHNGPSLALILSVCRNLTKILYKNPDPYALSGLSIPYSTKLVSLEIRAEKNELTETELDNLFQCTPHLRSLRLDGCSFDIVPHLKHASIHLVSLLVHPLEFQYGDDPDNYLTDKDDELVDQGRCVLRYFQNGGVISADSLKDIFEKNHDSLQKLGLATHHDIMDLGGSQPTTENWQDIGPLPIFNQLKALVLNSTHHSTGFNNKVPELLRNCPNINNLSLHEFTEHPSPTMFDPAADLKSLTYLEIFTMDLASAPLINLLERFVSQGKHCSLNTLELNVCYGTAGEAMLLISKLVNLQELTFGDNFDEYTTTICAEQFTRNLGRLPKLQILDITGIKFSLYALQLLCESKSLEYVSLNGMGELSLEVYSLFTNHNPSIYFSCS